MNTVIQTILNRRSCRAFTSADIDEDSVNVLLECARSAPSGMNLQTARFTAVMNRKKIEELSSAVREALNRDEGYNMYRPPVLIITSNEKESRFKEVDNACAMENIWLAAEALGLGCVWINQLNSCCDDPKVRKILTEWGIPESHGIYGCAAIGRKAEQPKEIQRKEIVTIIR